MQAIDRNFINSGRRGIILGGAALVLGAGFRPLRATAQPKQRIGVIGSGHIGGTIGGLWVKAGHPVLFSSRHPDELKDLIAGLGELAQAGTVDQAIAFGDVLFIAVPYAALPQIGRDYGAALQGKIMLDACNAVARATATRSPMKSSRRASASSRRSTCREHAWCAPSIR
jgi:8-hydroxy-5-deazaflavin:NADPH oxidoreductase